MLLEPGDVTNEGLVGLLTVNRDLFSRISLVVTCKIYVDYIIIDRSIASLAAMNLNNVTILDTVCLDGAKTTAAKLHLCRT